MHSRCGTVWNRSLPANENKPRRRHESRDVEEGCRSYLEIVCNSGVVSLLRHLSSVFSPASDTYSRLARRGLHLYAAVYFCGVADNADRETVGGCNVWEIRFLHDWSSEHELVAVLWASLRLHPAPASIFTCLSGLSVFIRAACCCVALFSVILSVFFHLLIWSGSFLYLLSCLAGWLLFSSSSAPVASDSSFYHLVYFFCPGEFSISFQCFPPSLPATMLSQSSFFSPLSLFSSPPYPV